MTWGMVAVAGASVVGGMMASDAASSAADAQVGASDRSVQAQRDIFNKQVELQDPYRQLGVGAGQRLSYLLGISPQNGIMPGVPVGTPVAAPAPAAVAPTSAPQGTAPQATPSLTPDQVAGLSPFWQKVYGAQQASQAMDPNAAPAVSAPGATAGSPATTTLPQSVAPDGGFGSLLKPFGAEDFQLDPGIQFQIQQGQQALQNSQSAKDGILSGAALKGLMTFNQGMAGTGYQSAFDRYMANKGFTLGSLMDMTKLGQSAASGAAANGAGYATSIGNTITGAGNAQAAGAIGQANAISGGLGGAANMFMLRNLMSGGGSGGGFGGVSGGGGVISDSPIANFA